MDESGGWKFMAETEGKVVELRGKLLKRKKGEIGMSELASFLFNNGDGASCC